MKKKSLVILIVIILLIIIGGGVAFAYFFTDMFKSKKDLFLKYISQNSEIIESLKDEDFNAYMEKQKSTPYTTAGSIKANLTYGNNAPTSDSLSQDNLSQDNLSQDNLSQDSLSQDSLSQNNLSQNNSSQEIINNLQNCSITFEGNVDKANKYNYQNIRANYSDAQSINFEILQENDIYATKINEVLNRFVGIENNNLKDFAAKLGLDQQTLSQIPDKIDFSQENFSSTSTENKKAKLNEKLSQIIENDLNSDMFVEEDVEGGVAYVLTLNKEDYVKIIKELLTTISEGENIFNETFTVDDLVNGAIKEENRIELKVYVKNRKLAKTQFTVLDENLNEIANISLTKLENGATLEASTSNDNTVYSISINKEKAANNIKYYFDFFVATQKIFDITMNFSGINTNEVQENSECNIFVGSENLDSLGLNEFIQGTDIKAIYTYSNKKTFVESIEKQDIANNVMTLNTAPNVEAIQNLFNQVETRLEQINTQKMKAAGIQSDQNPFVYYIPAILPVGATIAIQSPEYVGLPITISTKLALPSFIMFYGDNLILERAYEEQETQKEAIEREQQQIEELRKESDQLLEESKLQTFNSKWEVYAGRNISSSSVRTLVSAVIENNKTSEYKITVNGEMPTAMPDLDSTKTYTVNLSYGSNGLVNGVTYVSDAVDGSINDITTE